MKRRTLWVLGFVDERKIPVGIPVKLYIDLYDAGIVCLFGKFVNSFMGKSFDQ